MQNGRFPCKIALHFLMKVCYKVLCVNTVSDKVVRHSLAYLYVQKLFAGRRPLLLRENFENLAESDQRPTLFNSKTQYLLVTP